MGNWVSLVSKVEEIQWKTNWMLSSENNFGKPQMLHIKEFIFVHISLIVVSLSHLKIVRPEEKNKKNYKGS